MEFGNEYFEFVEAHGLEDPAKLRLKFHGDSRLWIPYAINNIAALSKKKKFRTADGRDYTPKVIPLEISAQQATSAEVARLHMSLAGNAPLRILDMTFGLGVDAAMLSLNPNNELMGFDLQEILVDAARVNFESRENVKVRCSDSVDFLEKYQGEPFDLIFIDPARRGAGGERLYNLHDCQPDITELLPLMRKKGCRVMAKLSPMLDITQTIKDLPALTQLHVVEEEGECKELLALLDFRQEVAEPEIVIDRLKGGKWKQYSFLRSAELLLQRENPDEGLTTLNPTPGMYLAEPSAATMKAAPFNLLSRDFKAGRLHSNTQVFLSESPLTDFPGKNYEIVKVWPFSSSNLKAISREVPQADITLKNFFGFTPETLRKRLKTKPGGELRLFAVTRRAPAGDERMILLTRPLRS